MDLDQPSALSAMRALVEASDALAATGRAGEARVLLDLAEAKAIAGMRLHKELVALGWAAPVRAARR